MEGVFLLLSSSMMRSFFVVTVLPERTIYDIINMYNFVYSGGGR